MDSVAPSAPVRARSRAALRRTRRGNQLRRDAPVRRLAGELGENPDAPLALAGKVSSDLLATIREHPTEVAELLRAVHGLSAKRVSPFSRQIRDRDW